MRPLALFAALLSLPWMSLAAPASANSSANANASVSTSDACGGSGAGSSISRIDPRAREAAGCPSTSISSALSALAPSPVVELNRAVAVSMVFGPAAGLELVDALASEARLSEYHLLPSVRGDLLEKLGRFSEARTEFGRAAALAKNGRERTLLLGRAAACGTGLQ